MFRKNNLQPRFLLTWKKTFPWINEVREDVYYAKCSLCGDGKLKIDNRGLSQVHRRVSFVKHQSMENKMKNQIRLTSTTHSNKEANSGFIFTDSENVSNAKILQVIHVVDTNQSFWSCKYDNDRFAKMFSVSLTAVSY